MLRLAGPEHCLQPGQRPADGAGVAAGSSGDRLEGGRPRRRRSVPVWRVKSGPQRDGSDWRVQS